MRPFPRVGRIYHVSIIIETAIFVSSTFVLLLAMSGVSESMLLSETDEPRADANDGLTTNIGCNYVSLNCCHFRQTLLERIMYSKMRH